MNKLPSEQAKRDYWKANLKWLAILLGFWALASYGCGILFVDYLDQFKLPGTTLNLGFWFAQQGSIYCFVILIFAYAVIMNRLDRKLLEGIDADSDS